MTLSTLFARAHVKGWDVRTWFRGATLSGTVLTIPTDADAVAFIERNWGEAFRAQVPGLVVVARAGEPAWTHVLNAKGKQAYRGSVRAVQERLVEQ